MGLVCCDLTRASLDVVVHGILPGSREPKEYSMVNMGVAFRRPVSYDLHASCLVYGRSNTGTGSS